MGVNLQIEHRKSTDRMVFCCRRCESWQALPSFLEQFKNRGTCNFVDSSVKPITDANDICGQFCSKLKLVSDKKVIAPGNKAA